MTWLIAECDFSQIEPRLIAEYIHRTVLPDNPLLEVYRQGRDLYKVTAAALMGKDYDEVTKQERNRAKPVALGFQYGMHAPTFIDTAYKQYQQVFTIDEAEHARAVFFDLWTGLEDWHEHQRMLARNHGYVETLYGRRRRLPDIASKDKDKKATAYRQAINSPIQGTGLDIMLSALANLHENPDLELVKPVLTVHDSAIFSVRQAHDLSRIRDGIVPSMLHYEPRMNIPLSVPLAVDLEIGPAWGQWEYSETFTRKGVVL